MKGKNPDANIKRIDGDEIKEIQPIAMYKIDDKQAYAICRDNDGKSEAVYCRQEAGKGKEWWGIGIPQSDSRNTDEKPQEAREYMDPTKTSSSDLSENADELEKAINLEEKGIPSKGGKGVQIEEINNGQKQNRQYRIEDIKEDLMSRDGITKEELVPPNYYDEKAKKILKLLESDENISYEEAIKRVEEPNREEGGRTPGDDKINGHCHK